MILSIQQKRLIWTAITLMVTALGKSVQSIPRVLLLLVAALLFFAPDTFWPQAWQEIHALSYAQVFQDMIYVIKQSLVLAWEVSFIGHVVIGFFAMVSHSAGMAKMGSRRPGDE